MSRLRRLLGLGFATLLAWLGVWADPAGALAATPTKPAGALAATATKVVRYHGYSLSVPAGWPVFHLATDPTACVRFDRHAVYLGQPGADQLCSVHAAGRTEAILVQPLRGRSSEAAAAAASRVLPAPSTPGAAAGDGTSAQLVDAARGVAVTATWSRNPAVIQHALNVRSLAALAAVSIRHRPRAAAAALAVRPRSAPSATAASAPAEPGGVYRGLGFDACAAPSPGHMSAWGSSPYRAVGIYIGGTNMACSQPNLTPGWVGRESGAGWHLIPIYIGLQAPSNECGCASFSPRSATNQGAAAAGDAIAQARALGLGAGNPLYFDMEAYGRGASTGPVLAFLGAWTARLHAAGYKSGVYSSSDSGIVDLVSRIGTGYQEPDDLWIANWNGARNTADPNVPSGDWPSHQRLHQYQGGHNERYGGVTINIDGDYVDAATAAAGSFAPALSAAPSLWVSPAANGSIGLYPSWVGSKQVSFWQVLAGPTPTSLTPFANRVSARKTAIVLHSAFAYFEVRALDSAGLTIGTSAPDATPSHLSIVGQRVFIPAHGIADMPVGCFNHTSCRVTTTISSGRHILLRTGPEMVPRGGGLVFFNLPRKTRALLGRDRHHRLRVQITARGASGKRATRRLTLVRYVKSGPRPAGAVTQSSALRIIGRTDFVSGGWAGGVLAVCSAPTPCKTSTTIKSSGKIIARTSRSVLGAGEVGYLPFRLTPAGHARLRHARGNQLHATVRITTAGKTRQKTGIPPTPTGPTTTGTPSTETTGTDFAAMGFPPTPTGPTTTATPSTGTTPTRTAVGSTTATAQVVLVSFS